VWQVLTDFARYPDWWPRNIRISPAGAPADLVGTDLRIQPRGGPAFRCRLERLVPEAELVFRYHDGPYRGTGVWRLERTATGTRVSYQADLVSDHWLLRFFSRLTDLGGAHSRLMKPVLAGLRRAVAGQPERGPLSVPDPLA
jgi:uncharacterized protein YndB with AHSA1/START domain